MALTEGSNPNMNDHDGVDYSFQPPAGYDEWLDELFIVFNIEAGSTDVPVFVAIEENVSV